VRESYDAFTSSGEGKPLTGAKMFCSDIDTEMSVLFLIKFNLVRFQMALVLPGQHGITDFCKFCDKTFTDKLRSSLNRHEKKCAKNPQRKNWQNWHCTIC
jgi:hypothetical protein